MLTLTINRHSLERGSSMPVTTIAKQGNLTAAKPIAGCAC